MVRIAAAERQRQSLVAYRLTFPKGLGAVGRYVLPGRILGLLLPWWKRWGTIPHVVIETLADSTGDPTPGPSFQRIGRPILENALAGQHPPSVRFERADAETLPVSVGAEYRLSARGRALMVDAPALSAKLLFGLQPLGENERVVVSWMLTPAGPVAPVRVASTGEKQRLWQPAGTVP